MIDSWEIDRNQGNWSTHIWMQLMMEPNRPTMPRNSTLLRFFTVYSWHTLDTAYSVALINTKQSPNRMFEAKERPGTLFHACGSKSQRVHNSPSLTHEERKTRSKISVNVSSLKYSSLLSSVSLSPPSVCYQFKVSATWPTVSKASVTDIIYSVCH